jgi:hypothetical protein
MSATNDMKELKRGIVAIAREMISGGVDLIVGARQINAMRLLMPNPNDPVFLPLRGFESETDGFIIDEHRRGNWSPEWLARNDQQRIDYLERARDGVLEDCEDLVREFSKE